MSGPTLALGISAPGYQQVIQMAEAVERLDRAVGSLGGSGGGSQLSGLAALTAEVTKMRQEMSTSAAGLRTDLMDLRTTVAKGMADAMASVAAAAKTGGQQVAREINKAAADTEAAADKLKKSVASVRLSASKVDLGDGLFASVSGKGLGSADSVRKLADTVKATEAAMNAAIAKDAELGEKASQAKALQSIKMGMSTMKWTQAVEESANLESTAQTLRSVKLGMSTMKWTQAVEEAANRESTAQSLRSIKLGMSTMKWTQSVEQSIAKEQEVAARQAAAIDLAARTAEAAYQRASSRAQARIALSAGSQLAQNIDPALVAQRFGNTALSTAQASDLDGLKARYAALSAAGKTLGDEHDKAAPKIKGLADQMKNAHSAARGLASGFGAMFLTWGAILPLLAGAAVSNGFVQVIKQGAEVQNTFTQIRVLAGATTEDVVVLNSVMSDMAKTSQFGPKQLADAMKTLSLAGLNASEVFSSVHDVLNFAVAGDTDIKQAADVMTSVATAFHVSAQGYGMVGDVIAKAAAESKSSVESMGAAFKTASVINQQYGVSLNDTAVGLALLANAGIQGTAAGTSLRNMYADLAGRTPKASAALQKLGVDVLDLNGKMKDQAVIFEQVVKGLAKFDGKSQFKLIQDIFSERGTKEAGAIMDALASKAKELGSSAANAYDELAQKVAQAAGFAATAAAQMALTPLNQMKSVVATLQNTLVGAFEDMQPFVLDFATKLKAAFNSDEFKSSLQSLLGLVADLTMAFVDHGKAIMSVIAMYVGFRAVIGIMAAVSAATVAWGEVTAAATTAVGIAGRAAAVANPLLAGLTAVLTLGAAAWALYEMWASKSKDTLKDLGTNNATELLKRLEEEEDRLKKVNAARSMGISLMELETKAALEKARNEVSPELATARKALSDYDNTQKALPVAGSLDYQLGSVPQNDKAVATERAKLVAAVTAAEVAYGDVLLRTERAMDGINAAARERDRLEKADMDKRTRATGSQVYTGTVDKPGHSSDMGSAGSETLRDMGALESSGSKQLKQLQDQYRAEEISAGEYGARMIQMRQDLEDKVIDIANRGTAQYDAAYEAKFQNLVKTVKDPKKLEEALNNLGNQYLAFEDKVNIALGKVSDVTDTDLADITSQYEQATNKMAKTDAAYWKRADQTMMKNLAQSKSLRDMAGASEEARAKAEAIAKVDASHAVELDKLQTEFAAAAKASDDFNTAMGNGAISDDESHNKFGEALVARMLMLKQALADANSEMNRLRFMAGEDAVNDLVNKQNQKWRDEAVKMGKDVTSKLADWVLSGGKGGFKSLFQWAADYLLKNPLKMVLEAVLQPVANGVTNVALQAMGLGTTNGGVPGMAGGSGGGGLSSLVSTGSNIYSVYKNGSSAYTLGSQYASGTMSGANVAGTVYGNATGTGIDGLLASNGAYGTAAGSSGAVYGGAAAGGAVAAGSVAPTAAIVATDATTGAAVAGGVAEGGMMAGLAAIPVWGWIAMAVIAIGSMMAKKGGGPKVDGMAGIPIDTDIKHGQYDASLVPVLTSVQGQYDSITKLLGGTSKAQFGIAVTSDPRGDSPTFVQSRAQVNGQDVFSDLNRNVGREDADMQAEVKRQTERAVLAALRASDITGAFADWVRNLGDVTGQALDDAFTRIDKVMNERTTLQSRLDDLKAANKAAVDSITALSDARTKERASYDALNKDILDRIYAQEDLKAATQDLVSAYNSQITAITDTTNALKTQITDLQTYAKSLRTWVSDSLLGDSSPLNAAEQMATASSQFDTTLALAHGGNADARNDLTNKASTYLSSLKDNASSRVDYLTGYAKVTSGLTLEAASAESKASTIQAEVDRQQGMLDTAKAQLESLGVINNSVVDFATAWKKYQDAKTAADALEASAPQGSIIVPATSVPDYVTANKEPPITTQKGLQDFVNTLGFGGGGSTGNSGGAFATGGYHWGGARLVGEHGPELEVTGASYIHDAAATRRLLSSDDSAGGNDLTAEVRNLRHAIEANVKWTFQLAKDTRELKQRGFPVRNNDDGTRVSVLSTAG